MKNIKSVYVIINTFSGLKKGEFIFKSIESMFTKNNFKLSVSSTLYQGHAIELIKNLNFELFDAICVLGGDGTIHEVINGMLLRLDHKILPLGIIPCGTGNSLMHDRNCLEPIDAVKRIINWKLSPLDIAKIDCAGNLTYSFNLIGWGMATDISRRAEDLRVLGLQRYNAASLVEIALNTKRKAKLIVEGQELIANYSLIIACNTIHIGKAMKIAPKAKINDGLIDLIIAKESSRLKLLSLFPKLFDGSHADDPLITYKQVKSFSIIPEDTSKLNIDGEIKEQTPISVNVEKGLINILV